MTSFKSLLEPFQNIRNLDEWVNVFIFNTVWIGQIFTDHITFTSSSHRDTDGYEVNVPIAAKTEDFKNFQRESINLISRSLTVYIEEYKHIYPQAPPHECPTANDIDVPDPGDFRGDRIDVKAPSLIDKKNEDTNLSHDWDEKRSPSTETTGTFNQKVSHQKSHTEKFRGLLKSFGTRVMNFLGGERRRNLNRNPQTEKTGHHEAYNSPSLRSHVQEPSSGLYSQLLGSSTTLKTLPGYTKDPLPGETQIVPSHPKNKHWAGAERRGA